MKYLKLLCIFTLVVAKSMTGFGWNGTFARVGPSSQGPGSHSQAWSSSIEMFPWSIMEAFWFKILLDYLLASCFIQLVDHRLRFVTAASMPGPHLLRTLFVAAVSTESASGSVYKVVVMPSDKVSEIRDKAVEAFVELGWSEEVLERLNICIWRAGGWEPMHGNRTLGSY